MCTQDTQEQGNHTRGRVLRRLRIVHLTDTHVLQGGALHHGYDTQRACHRVFERLDALPDVDAVVVSGDVSEDGSPDSYGRACRLVTDWADARHAPVSWAMGNHDERAAFRAQFVAHGTQPDVLGSSAGARKDDPQRPDMQRPGAQLAVGLAAGSAVRQTSVQPPIYGVREGMGARFITLDTSVPGKGFGMLDAGQLHWLAGVLSTPAKGPFGSVIVMHHPPIAAATTLMRALGLVNPAEFTAVVAGSDVRAVLCGHNHMAQFGVLPGTSIPVCIGAPVTARANLLGPEDEERAEHGSGATVVDLIRSPDGSVTTSCFPITAPEATDGVPLSTLDRDDVTRIAAASGLAQQ